MREEKKERVRKRTVQYSNEKREREHLFFHSFHPITIEKAESENEQTWM